MTPARAVKAYREAAQRIFGLTKEEAAASIVTAKNDPGGWSDNAAGIIYLEDQAIGPHLSYYGSCGFENCLRLAEEAGIGGFIEYVNSAVAAIHLK
jgi:hypothetical protein